ncbi:hypothetical protein HanPSC8_Chr13g0566931 [Helianthus annuus]|nr:hypothetical protein HanPSC8_Chr13g0566931 [Helianthus annuus]
MYVIYAYNVDQLNHQTWLRVCNLRSRNHLKFHDSRPNVIVLLVEKSRMHKEKHNLWQCPFC